MQCSICLNNYDSGDLLQTSEDKFFCKNCFQAEYSSAMKPSLTSTCETDSTTPPRGKMFSIEEIARIKRNRNINQAPHSKGPIQCPHNECNRQVSIHNFSVHFQHEHMEVPIIDTTLDARNSLIFDFKDIQHGIKHCLVLFNLVLQETEHSRSKDKSTAPVTVVVIASRFGTVQLFDEDTNTTTTTTTDDETTVFLLENKDKIIIWVGSNIWCDLSYTVAVSTANEHVRVKYYGPLLQLHKSSMELCLEGHMGLVLSHYHIMGMSENETKPVYLDVILHSKD